MSHLIKLVKVKSGYEVEIEFAIDFRQLDIAFDSSE